MNTKRDHGLFFLVLIFIIFIVLFGIHFLEEKL